MAATNRPLVRAQNTPAPQYYNAKTDQYEVIEGRDGANSFIQLGTVAMESWQGNSNIIKSFTGERFGFSIINDGDSDVVFTINGNTRTLKQYESYSALFEPFFSVKIVTSSNYRAEVLR